MIDSSLLAILSCPQTRTPLSMAPTGLIELINRQIAAGTLRNMGGRPVSELIDGGLWHTDGLSLYPISLGVPRLVSGEALLIESASGVEDGDDALRQFAQAALTPIGTARQAHEAETSHYQRFHHAYDALLPSGYCRLLQAGALPGEGVVLDLGGGSGAFGRELARERRRRVVVCDLSRHLLLAGKKKSEHAGICWIETDAQRLPFADNSIDGIVLGSVLHHFPDFSVVARECFRVLKPGGICATADPNGQNWMMWLLRHPSSPFFTKAGRSDNERWLCAPEVEKVFAENGFMLAGRHGVRGVVYRLATFCAREEDPPVWARFLLAGWNALERVLGLLPAAPFWLGSWMVMRFAKPTGRSA